MSSESKKAWNPFSTEQWLGWLGATLVAAISMMIFLYTHFLTTDTFDNYKESQSQFQEEIEKRLDRIEDKLDEMLKRK